MPRFPKLIHVVEEGDSDSKYLAAYTDGVVGIEEPGKPVAIYQLVDVGTVNIQKAFISRKSNRKRR